jgi:hypothetical protein
MMSWVRLVFGGVASQGRSSITAQLPRRSQSLRERGKAARRPADVSDPQTQIIDMERSSWFVRDFARIGDDLQPLAQGTLV